MRTLMPIALLVGSIAAGSSVHSATEGSPAPAGSLSGKTYLGTFKPAAQQPPTASGPSAYDDGKAASPRSAPKSDAPASVNAPTAQAPAAQRPAGDTKPDTGDPDTAPRKPEPAATQGPDKSFDVKNNFRNICSFCHADYGRKAGRGPQLMDSSRSDEFLFDRIKHGLTGRMPGFGGTYSDAQINQFVKFIRSLKPGEEPKNPA